MLSPDPVYKQIEELEKKLADPSFRKSEDISDLIADNFIEYGSSGIIYNKPDVIKFLLEETLEKITIKDFRARIIAPEVFLLTYISEKNDDKNNKLICSLRSSIWKFTNKRWQIIFHQGTPVPAEQTNSTI